MTSFEKCEMCPRKCKINRSNTLGFCKANDKLKIARATLHFWEEPCISGTKGSGTVFFSNCNLKCCYCQNHDISHEGFGKEISVTRLSEIFLELQAKGAHNINLVTPTQWTPCIIEALDMVKSDLKIPVVYNCGGYEDVEVIKSLKNYVDIFIPDLKYYSDELAIKYSNAPNYFNIAIMAIKQMVKQTGGNIFDENGIMQKGVIVRHLALPNHTDDSIKILENLFKNVNKEDVLISLMSQYTPVYKSFEFKEISRKISTYEYKKVLIYLDEINIENGFFQDRSSANSIYTPPFDLEGV